ncbi:sulfur carrier protein ThiS [Virgibacillus ainsalahensis]
MNLLVNGNEVNVPGNVKTITDVIGYFFNNPPVVIVEHNGEILDLENHSNKEVTNGDKLELVQFVGGG